MNILVTGGRGLHRLAHGATPPGARPPGRRSSTTSPPAGDDRRRRGPGSSRPTSRGRPRSPCLRGEGRHRLPTTPRRSTCASSGAPIRPRHARVNVLGSLNLLEALRARGRAAGRLRLHRRRDLRRSGRRRPAAEYASRLTPCRPTACAKLAVEKYLALLPRRGRLPRLTILRYANVYGPAAGRHGRGRRGRNLLKPLLAGEHSGDLRRREQTRDYVYVGDRRARPASPRCRRRVPGVFGTSEPGSRPRVNALFALRRRRPADTGSPRRRLPGKAGRADAERPRRAPCGEALGLTAWTRLEDGMPSDGRLLSSRHRADRRGRQRSPASSYAGRTAGAAVGPELGRGSPESGAGPVRRTTTVSGRPRGSRRPRTSRVTRSP